MKRPFFLNLLQIRFPIPAIMSIAHRLAGFYLSLSLPVFIYLWQKSLLSAQDYEQVQQWLQSFGAQWLLFLTYWALFHHLLAGLRYLALDLDWGIDRPAYRYSAGLVLILSPLLSLLCL